MANKRKATPVEEGEDGTSGGQSIRNDRRKKERIVKKPIKSTVKRETGMGMKEEKGTEGTRSEEELNIIRSFQRRRISAEVEEEITEVQCGGWEGEEGEKDRKQQKPEQKQVGKLDIYKMTVPQLKQA